MKKKIYIFCSLIFLITNSIAIFAQDTIRQIKILKGQHYLNFPVKETNKLTRTKILHEEVVDQFTIKLVNPLHVIAEFEKGDGTQFGLNIQGFELSYNDLLGEFSIPSDTIRTTTVYSKPNSEFFKIEAIVDKNIIEVFVNDGELYYAVPFNSTKNGKVDVFIKGWGDTRKSILKKLEVHELKSIWNIKQKQ